MKLSLMSNWSHRSPVVISFLTSSSNGKLDARRMPGPNTGHLTETLVSLPRQLLGVPTRSNTLHSVTFGYTNDINHLVLSEHILYGNGLLHMLTSPLKLLLNGAPVELDFHNVSLLLTAFQQGHLGVSDHTDDLNKTALIKPSSNILMYTRTDCRLTDQTQKPS